MSEKAKMLAERIQNEFSQKIQEAHEQGLQTGLGIKEKNSNEKEIIITVEKTILELIYDEGFKAGHSKGFEEGFRQGANKSKGVF